MVVGDIVTEGKTKIIRSNGEGTVLIESKSDILNNKEVLATETTCNCFTLLNRRGIPTHFIKQENEKTFLAKRVQMIPFELVARRIAAGSYLKRNPDVAEGTIFPELVLEAFLKADDLYDPYIIWNDRTRKFELYSAQEPVSAKSYRLDFPMHCIQKPYGSAFTVGDMDELKKITRQVFLILEVAWEGQGVTLADLKIECGWTSAGFLVVADVINNDSWRIWPGGENYAEVAQATKKFI